MKKPNYGVLRYKGRSRNPATFKTQGIDLRRLVGVCFGCGSILRGNAAIPEPDPYNQDLYGDSTPVVQCHMCKDRAADEL